MKTRLYRLIYGVKPIPGHPKYQRITHALVHIYLFAEALDEAKENANSIIKALPYELVCEEAAVSHGDIQPIDLSPERAESHAIAVACAWQVGFGLAFDCFTWEKTENWFLKLFAKRLPPDGSSPAESPQQ